MTDRERWDSILKGQPCHDYRIPIDRPILDEHQQRFNRLNQQVQNAINDTDARLNRAADLAQARCQNCDVSLSGPIGDHRAQCPWIAEQARMAQNAYVISGFKLTAGFGDERWFADQPKPSLWRRFVRWVRM